MDVSVTVKGKEADFPDIRKKIPQCSDALILYARRLQKKRAVGSLINYNILRRQSGAEDKAWTFECLNLNSFNCFSAVYLVYENLSLLCRVRTVKSFEDACGNTEPSAWHIM